MIKSLFVAADAIDSLGCCPTPFQYLLPLKRLKIRNNQSQEHCYMVFGYSLSLEELPGGMAPNLFYTAVIVRSASGFL